MSSNTIQKSVVPFKLGLTIDEAAAYTGIGRNTLRKLVKHEKSPVFFSWQKERHPYRYIGAVTNH